MSNKHTYCPSCMTTYKVTVAQLTVAQGLVCCPKCNTSFNALTHLVTEKKQPAAPVTPPVVESSPAPTSTAVEATSSQMPQSALQSHKLLEIFDLKIENSNIDLKTYLNNLNYFSTEPIGTLPAVNWSDQEEEKKHGIWYYIAWTVFNAILIGTLAFQFFWFNPQYLKNNPFMSKTFNTVCDLFHCSNLQEHYSLITVNKVKIQALPNNQTQFRGEMVNFHDRSLALPILLVKLKDEQSIVASYQLQPQEYLIPSLAMIERIPQNSPFKFEFTLPVDRKTFQGYDFEIIQP
jgi:predicted Zn finger-like uncharacterized protein